MGLRVGVKLLALYKASSVVPFWVCRGCWVRDYKIIPIKELRRSLGKVFLIFLGFMGAFASKLPGGCFLGGL